MKTTGLFLTCALIGVVLTAVDLAAQNPWTQAVQAADWSARSGHAAVEFKGRLWVLGGGGWPDPTFSDVWSSEDGIDWRLETFHAGWTPRAGHAAVVFNERLWVFGGKGPGIDEFYADAWWTENGVTWHPANLSTGWQGRHGHAVTVMDGELWLLGGTIYAGFGMQDATNDVWRSSDGANWTRVTDSAAWPARKGHAATAFNGRLWVLGGNVSGDDIQKDVWSSHDGQAWVREADGAWYGRENHTAAVFDGRLWVMGGHALIYPDYGASLLVGDVWFTEDGAQWTNLEGSLPSRSHHAMAVFNHRMWVLGGETESIQQRRNDVWYLIAPPRIVDAAPPPAVAGVRYEYEIIVNSWLAPDIQASGLPGWLTLQGGVLAGTPLEADIGLSDPITIAISTTEGEDSAVFQIEVQGAPPRILSAPPAATLGAPYHHRIVVEGIPAPTLSALNLPAWLSFEAETGELTGTPVAVGESETFTVVAANGWPPNAQADFTVQVRSGITAGRAGAGGCAVGGGLGAWALLLLLSAQVLAPRSRKTA